MEVGVSEGETRMNRTDRLLAMVLQLRLHKALRAEDLAAHFEISVRTVYRDMQALGEAGVPIVSLMGQGYRLGLHYIAMANKDFA
jgi:predicted DNA-binding transcriptional regulator YafY